MLDLAMLRFGKNMLQWSREALVRELDARGMLASAGEPADPEILADRDGESWNVRLAPGPTLRDGEAALEKMIGRRSEVLIALTRAVLTAPPRIAAADLAPACRMVHRSLLPAILRGRALRRDGDVVSFDELVDFDGRIETRRTSELQYVIDEARDSHGLGDASATEWPNNVLSARTTVLDGGVFGRESDPSLVARYRQDELRHAEALANAALAIMGGANVGLGSEAEHVFEAFVSVAPPEGRVVPAIDEAFVRALFGGTIAPFDRVSVEALGGDARFWARVPEADAATWRSLVAHFDGETALKHARFVEIGDGTNASPLPAGVASHGSVLPRLIVGITEQGSVAGLIGLVVST